MRIQTEDNFINEVMELEAEFRELESIQSAINEMMRDQAELMLRMRDLSEQPPSRETVRSTPYVQLLNEMLESMRIIAQDDLNKFGSFLTSGEASLD